MNVNVRTLDMVADRPAPPQLANEAAALAAARALSGVIKARAIATEEGRVVPKDTIDDLMDAGLFGLVMPRVFGGSELGFSTLVQTTIEIGSACGSTGWVYGVLAGHSWLLNLFPLQAQQDVLADPRALAATVFRLNSTVKAEEGGYRLTGGEGRFCSGIDHAAWVIIGSAVQQASGPPEPRFFLVPREEIEIVDDWFTAGMRGTGSKSIRIKDVFIPEHRSVMAKAMVEGVSPGSAVHEGPLYRMAFNDVAPFSIVGAPLGMALGAVRLFSESLKARFASASELGLADESATLARVATAAAQVDAAIALVVSAARMIESAEGPESLSVLDRARIPRDWAYAVQTARKAVNEIFEVAGGSGIYNGSDIQRFWRDVNAGAQHVAFGWDKSMVNFGRSLAGHSPLAFQVKR